MALSAVQNNPNSDLRRQSFLKSAAYGAVAGYAAKWAIPILSQEEVDVLEYEKKFVGESAKQDAIVMTKSLRPTQVFALTGLGFGILSALVHNVYVENAKRGSNNENMDVLA